MTAQVIDLPTSAVTREPLLSAMTSVDAFTRELATIESIESGRELLDKVKAVERYAQVKRLGLEATNEVATARIRIERKLGAMLAETVRVGKPKSGHDDRIRLADLGVTQNESKHWQREASVPDEDFERYIAEAREERDEITSAGVLRLATIQKRYAKAVTNATDAEFDEAIANAKAEGDLSPTNIARHLAVDSDLDLEVRSQRAHAEIEQHCEAMARPKATGPSPSPTDILRGLVEDVGSAFSILNTLHHCIASAVDGGYFGTRRKRVKEYGVVEHLDDLRLSLEEAKDAIGVHYDDLAQICGLPTREQS